MQRFNKSHLKWLIPFLIVIVILSSIGIYHHLRDTALERFYYKDILNMSPDTTAKMLEKDGYLNLTRIQEGRITDINHFLHSDSIFRPVILKTFQETEDDLVIRYFYRPDGSQTVFMYTTFVAGQSMLNPNCPFSVELLETTNSDGITEVWLVQPEELRAPYYTTVLDPVLFYSYQPN